MVKIALITGITGQDGSYLAELLLEKGYDVHGIIRRSSSYNTQRIEHLMDNKNLHLHYGDLTDSVNLIRLVKEIEPDEIYNLGAQSHVKISWDCLLFLSPLTNFFAYFVHNLISFCQDQGIPDVEGCFVI